MYSFSDVQAKLIGIARKKGLDLRELTAWVKQHWDVYTELSIKTEEQLDRWLELRVQAFEGYLKAKEGKHG